MPHALKELLASLGGEIIRHVAGSRPISMGLRINKQIRIRRGRESRAEVKISALEGKRPVTTTVFQFPTTTTANTAVSEGFRHIHRNALNAEIYQGTIKGSSNRVVVNFFDIASARKWEKAINRARTEKLFGTRFKRRGTGRIVIARKV